MGPDEKNTGPLAVYMDGQPVGIAYGEIQEISLVKETGRLVWGAYKYIDLQDLRERGMVEEFTTAAERRRIERGADNGGLSPAT